MNKFLAIFFALLGIGLFGLSQRDSYQTQESHGRYGSVAGKVLTVQITPGDRIGYRVFGAASMVACLYFVSRIRRGGLRK